MRIINYSPNIEEPKSLAVLLTKLESSSFADECRYRLSDFGRYFSCVFIKDGHYSKEDRWHIKYLSNLANNIIVLQNKAKEIDTEWEESNEQF